MGRSRIGTCTYCGERARITQEHVVPECLFPKPLPLNMVTVGTCFSCNNGKSKDDAYLRDCLLADLETVNSVAAQTLRGGTFKRSVQTNRSEVAKTALKRAHRIPLHTPNGIYLGSPFAVPVDGDRRLLETPFPCCGTRSQDNCTHPRCNLTPPLIGVT